MKVAASRSLGRRSSRGRHMARFVRLCPGRGLSGSKRQASAVMLLWQRRVQLRLLHGHRRRSCTTYTADVPAARVSIRSPISRLPLRVLPPCTLVQHDAEDLALGRVLLGQLSSPVRIVFMPAILPD